VGLSQEIQNEIYEKHFNKLNTPNLKIIHDTVPSHNSLFGSIKKMFTSTPDFNSLPLSDVALLFEHYPEHVISNFHLFSETTISETMSLIKVIDDIELFKSKISHSSLKTLLPNYSSFKVLIEALNFIPENYEDIFDAVLEKVIANTKTRMSYDYFTSYVAEMDPTDKDTYSCVVFWDNYCFASLSAKDKVKLLKFSMEKENFVNLVDEQVQAGIKITDAILANNEVLANMLDVCYFEEDQEAHATEVLRLMLENIPEYQKITINDALKSEPLMGAIDADYMKSFFVFSTLESILVIDSLLYIEENRVFLTIPLAMLEKCIESYRASPELVAFLEHAQKIHDIRTLNPHITYSEVVSEIESEAEESGGGYWFAIIVVVFLIALLLGVVMVLKNRQERQIRDDLA